MSIPVDRTTQRYISQDCKQNISGWKRSGMESVLNEGDDVQNHIIKSSVNFCSKPVTTFTRIYNNPTQGMNPTILKLQENNFVHD